MSPSLTALVIGAGPAGLMAAEEMAKAGMKVIVCEAKPSVARKFLMAGKSGLNLTKAEPEAQFNAAFAEAAPWLAPMLHAFGPEQVQAWARALGQEVFTGSTGRVFPVVMKGSPLLRAWLARLSDLGVEVRTRWRWTSRQAEGWHFQTPEGTQILQADRVILAMGGASWSRLGSDGAWAPYLVDMGAEVAPFQPANAGLLCQWSDHMQKHFGAALKGIALTSGGLSGRGEIAISARGLEGGGLYPLTPALRTGHDLILDLFPDVHADALVKRLIPKGKDSLSNRLRKAGLSPAATALLMEVARPLPNDPEALAGRLKALKIPHQGPRPMDEAISTAGGITRASLGADLQLLAQTNVFAAGEMLDWEAPTGGYLLTACFATGRWAGRCAAGLDPRI